MRGFAAFAAVYPFACDPSLGLPACFVGLTAWLPACFVGLVNFRGGSDVVRTVLGSLRLRMLPKPT